MDGALGSEGAGLFALDQSLSGARVCPESGGFPSKWCTIPTWMVLLMNESKTASIRIGHSRFRMSSDDVYLKQFRSGTGNAIANAVRRAAGADAFEPGMAHLFSHLVRRDDICLDVGANIGCTAILFAQLGKQVVALEPTPRTFSFLRSNVERSGLLNIQCTNFALGNEDKSAMISYSAENRGGAFVDETAHPDGEMAQIEVRRLDTMFPSLGIGHIDFMKLDIEGYERKAIEGAWNTISQFRPIIQLELNSWCLNALHRISMPDFLDFLCDRFPIVYGIQRREYADIHTNAGRWLVMRKNILEQRFKEAVVAFDASRLDAFHATYKRAT
jgi:FkbM family methyltransferase